MDFRHAAEKRACAAVAFLAVFSLLAGCAGKHFHDAGTLTSPPVRYDLARNPSQEYWTGIIFSGDKIGFSHLRMAPVEDSPGSFTIESEAFFSFRLFMMQKTFSLKSRDIIGADLSLQRFESEIDLDGSLMHQAGEVRGDELILSTVSSGNEQKERIPLEGKVYPLSVMYLYPAVRGLEIGRSYEYSVYDEETRSVSKLKQKVLACEESDLFEGRAFKVRTSLHGEETTSWIDEKAQPLLEKALGGMFVSGLEPESRARSYLASAALNKKETMIDFSLVKTDRPIPHARETSFLEAALIGMGRETAIPNDSRQSCAWEGGKLICRITAGSPAVQTPLLSESQRDAYLRATFAVTASDGRIRSMAAGIVKDIPEPRRQVNAFVEWIGKNIRKESMDVFTAVDVLEKKRAECQGHAILYAAFARSEDIPTRVVNGIVYSEEMGGFLYHTWAESYVDNQWISVDPTFGQLPSDATHIKFVEGEKPEDLIPLVGLIGKIRAEIIQVK